MSHKREFAIFLDWAGPLWRLLCRWIDRDPPRPAPRPDHYVQLLGPDGELLQTIRIPGFRVGALLTALDAIGFPEPEA